PCGGTQPPAAGGGAKRGGSRGGTPPGGGPPPMISSSGMRVRRRSVRSPPRSAARPGSAASISAVTATQSALRASITTIRRGRPWSRAPGGMLLAPVTRDVPALGEPHLSPALRVRREAREPSRASRPPRDPTVQPDRHHARACLAFLPELVEGVAEIGEEVVGEVQRAPPETDVVGVEGVGHDEPGAGGRGRPV